MQNKGIVINKLSNIKFFKNNILFILNFLFIASSLTFIVKSDYKIYDMFGLP